MQLSRVLVLSGGLSHERDVSIRSGRRVAEALRSQGIEVSEIDSDSSLLPTLSSLDSGSVIFPTLHGAAGEDGAIRDIFEMLNLPYVGSTADACRRSFDKPVAKGIVEAVGIRVPASRVLPHSTFRELGAKYLLPLIEKSIGLPLMVKPAKGGSALGANVVRTAAELPEAMISAFSYGSDVVIEPFIAGREIAVSVIEESDGTLTALPVVEIVADSGFYSYNARYTAGLTEFFVPANIDSALSARATDVAKKVHSVLGLRDLSRSDLIIDNNGEVWFLEVNVAPGMTETSLLPQSVAATGRDIGTLYKELAERALLRKYSTSQ
jgi:D-alanine-D-alanine ligase